MLPPSQESVLVKLDSVPVVARDEEGRFDRARLEDGFEGCIVKVAAKELSIESVEFQQ